MNQRRKLLSVLAAAALAAPAAAFAQGAGGAIVIGQSAPLSGSNKDLGTDIRNGAAAYFKRVNDAGGVNGRKIEFMSLDDANDTKRSEANTKQLLEQNNPIALFGYGGATLSRPALPLVEAARIPFVAPFTGADPMRKFNRYVYNHRASYADELERIVEHFTTFGIKRSRCSIRRRCRQGELRRRRTRAQVAQPRAGGDRFGDAHANRLHQGARGGRQVEPRRGDPDHALQDLRRLHQGDEEAGRRRAVREHFVRRLDRARQLARGRRPRRAMSQVVPSYLGRSVPVVKEYQAAMEAAYGMKEFSYTSLEWYIAAKVLVEGLRRAGPQPTREKLLAALDTVSNYDVGGYMVTFSPDNHNGSNFVSLTILGRDLAFRE